MKFLSLTFWSIFLVTSLFSQASAPSNVSDAAFDSTFYHIYIHTASESLPDALHAADSLYQTAVTDVHRVRALMLIGDVYHRMANRDSVIHYAERAARIAERARIYSWQARIYGVLSTQYRETGLLSQGRKYLALGLKASEMMDNPDAANQFKGQVYQESGFYSLVEDNPRQAIIHFKQADLFFKQLPASPNQSLFLAQNEERLGVCYQQVDMLDSAHHHFSNALAFSADATDAETPLKGFIYNGLGEVNMVQGQFEKALSFFTQALTTAEVTEFPNLQIKVYQSLASYYQLTNDMEAYVRYNEKYLEAIRNNASRHRGYADHIVAKAQARLDEMTDSRKNIILVASLLLGVLAVGAGIYIGVQRRNYRRFKLLIQRLKDAQPPDVALSVIGGNDDSEREIMPEATKLELLKKLEQFEAGHEFTDRNISIAVLAGKMKTNTKYLSHIINKYKRKDFNTYVNALRVDYIINKMRDNPKYLNYKISYLAEEAGFSSHSKFTTVFKNVAGLSPSTFIEYLKKNNKKQSFKTETLEY